MLEIYLLMLLSSSRCFGTPVDLCDHPAYRGEPYYWPFNGPLTTRSMSEPFVGAAYDWYAFLPKPSALSPESDSDVGRLLLAPPRLPAAPPLIRTERPVALTDRTLCLPRVEASRSAIAAATVLNPAALYRDLTDPDERRRLACVVQLGQLKTSCAIDPLMEVLTGDPSPQVRQAAVRSLARLGAVYALQRAADTDLDQDVRRLAGFAAGLLQPDPRPVIPANHARPLFFLAWGLDF